MGWAHATRNIKRASTDTLVRLRDAAAVLIEHDQQISPRVMTDLLLIREETTAALQETGQTADGEILPGAGHSLADRGAVVTGVHAGHQDPGAPGGGAEN
jgi:hypothetical protein